MSNPRISLLVTLLPALLLLASAGPGNAQSGSGTGSFGTVAIGQTSSVQSVTMTFTGAGTLATQLALTEGAQNQDFTIVPGGSCATGQSYQAGGSCSVSVKFAPRYAGLRKGAVVLEDASGNALASTYISGVGLGPQAGFHVATRQLTNFSNLTFAADRGIAVDGGGNLFAASIGSGGAGETVVEIPAGCTAQACVKQLPGSFGLVQGLAVDGAGNLWVGDVAASGSITEIMAAGGYNTAKTYSGSFGFQIGVAVDGSGNVYFTGGSSGGAYMVTELVASSGYATVQTLASGYNTLGGIAVDSAGDVFFADPFARVVQEIVAVNGSIPSTPTIKSLGSGLKSLTGLALDGGGNVYAAGNAMIYQLPAASGYATVNELSNQTNPLGLALDASGNIFGIDYANQALGGVSTNSIFELPRSAAPSLDYSNPTAPGEIDTADGPHRVFVESIGNQPLSLSGLSVSNGNFSLDASTTCTASSTLAIGDSCLLEIVFNPLTTGDITGTLSVTGNALNAGAATETIALSGRSLYTPTIHVLADSWVIAVSQDLIMTITIKAGSGSPTPTGSVQVSMPGYASGPLTLSNGSAIATVPGGSLSPGQVVFSVSYQPDTAGAAFFVPVQGQGGFTVTKTLMNKPSISVLPAVSYLSAGQALTVTVGVSQASGAPMPTGTVTLTGGNYTSPATVLSGSSITITIPANSLIVGTDQLVATYTPDAASSTIYVTAQGVALVSVSAAPFPAGAQPVDFGSLGIGTSSAPQPVTLTFPANSTPATLIATMQGAMGKEFAIASGGSCGAGVNEAAGQSCTVNVVFTPAFAGVRNGAVVAQDANGKTLALTYLHGSGSGAQISIQSQLYGASFPSSFATLSDGFSRPDVAVDGAGNVFVGDLGNAAVREIPAGCTSASCTVTVMSGLYWPTAVAVDGAGNLFVTESGYGNVKKIPLGCKSPSCMETVGSGFNQPYGLAVDSSGNVFVADTFNNAIKEVMAAGGYTTIKTLASGLDLPWSVVVNASGDLFVAEGGDQCTPFIPGSCSQINTSLVEITAASGYQTVTTLAGGIFGKPFGLAIDGGGNVYEADYGDTCATEYTAGSSYTTAHRLCSTLWLLYPEGLAVDSAGNLYLDDVIRGAVYKLDFADVPTITFKTATLKGVADGQDGPQVVSVQNNGTVPLTFTAISLSDSSFQFNSTLTTCSASTPLAVGSSCDLAVNFLPTTTGPLPGTLTLTDNNLNQSPATQVIQIVAVALPPTPVILTNPATSTTATSATFTFSDTQTPITFVCSIDSLPFSACSSPIAYSTLGGGPHAFQVKARDLAGNLSLAAVYNWTVNSVGPPAPVITSAPAYLTNDDTAAFSFTDTQAGVSYQCSLDGAAFTACTSGVSYSGLAPGGPTYYLNVLHHSFAVKAMDASNNFSPETTRAWTAASFTFSAYPVDFGLVPVGQTSSAQSITFNIGTAFTVATIDAVTMGVTGLDFTVSDPGTCAVGMALAKGSTCTLKATFTPRYPGQRKGAVLLLDSSGNGIGEAYLQGTGTAPQVTFGPYSTIFYNILAPQNNSDPGKNLYAPVSDVAVDGAGNVYAADMLIASSDGSIAVSTGDIWKFPAGCTGPTCSTLVATERNTVESAGIPLILPIGMTMDGAGNLWVDNYYLWPEGLATVGVWNTSQCSYIGGYSSYYFMRTAVDGAGDAALLGNGLLQNCYQNLGVGQTTQTTSFDFSGNTPSLTVDPAGNYFVADSGNNAIKEVVASSNYTISRAVGSGFSGPNGVASDAYGNIYVSDTGNNALKEIVAASGYTQVLTLATFDPKSITPENLTVDALGNVYIALANVTQTGFNSSLTNQFVKLDFSDAPALNFPTATKIGTTDTADGTLTATVKNTGNQPLTIGGLALSNTNFMIDAGATTCSASAPLAMGGSCTIGVVFTPNATGSLTGMLTLTDNALNASGTTQQFALTGTGYTTPTTSAPTVAVAPASGSITTAQSDSVTVTVSGASGKPTPTGTVSLIGGSYISAAVTLSGGSASFTIPAGILAVGSTTMNAVYTPDTASSTTYGTGAGSATISVTAVSTSTPTVSVTPAAIDISTQQSLAVTISVSGGSGNPTPTGSVTLSGGNYASLATVLGNGSATITIPAGYLPAGPVDLTAYYTPDPAGQANYTSASGTGQVAVQAAAKSTPPVTVIPASASIAANRPLQVTIQVSGGNGKSAPTGSVVLSSGSYVSATAVLSQGNVSVSIPADALAAGTDTLTASYTPDNTSSLTFNSATGSGTVTVSTPVFSTLTTLQASAATISIGSSITFTAAVAESSGTAIPSGTVTFIDGATALGTGTLNGAGSAAFITSSLALGTHSITAVYAGDSGNSGSSSAAFIVTVNPLTAQAINFTQPTSPVTYSSGLQIPLVATGGASGNPVVFTLDASSTATGSINANTLTVTSIGTLVIDANQTGNSNYSAAAQVQRTVVVNALIAQTINFTQPTSPVVYTSGLQIALSATGGASGNPVVFTLDASSTATGSITGNTLTVNGAGNLVIDANQAGNANYSSAPQVQRTVVVTSDFSISVTPPAQSIQRGASAQYTITLAAAGGSFNNTVTLSATGLPAGATGAFSPPTLTPGSGSGTSTLTVQTAASAGMARPNLWPLSTPVLALIFLLPLRRWRRVLGGKVLLLVAGLASLSCAIALTGCGGGWAGTPQSQSYTLTITANSGSDTHSTTVQLTVQ